MKKEYYDNHLMGEIKKIAQEYLEKINSNKYSIDSSESLILSFELGDNLIDEKLMDRLIILKKSIEYGTFEKSEDLYWIELLLKYCIVIDKISKKENLIKFSNSINKYLLKVINDLIKKFEYSNKKYFFDFFPLMGNTLCYLSDFNLDTNEISNFLINSISFKDVNGISIPNFFINNIDETFNKYYPKGIIPLGMAHGSLKPLIALSKFYSKGNKEDKLKKSIVDLFNLYEVFSRVEEDMLIYPNFVTYDEYINKTFGSNIKQHRCAWCSGYLITSYSLFLICRNMEWNKKEKFYYNEVITILRQDIKDYNLEIPIICHGYSFPLIIINSLIRINYSNDNEELKMLVEKREELIDVLLKILSSEKPDKVIEKDFYSNYSILNGVSGVLLALNSCRNDDPLIEKLLLIKRG